VSEDAGIEPRTVVTFSIDSQTDALTALLDLIRKLDLIRIFKYGLAVTNLLCTALDVRPV
jgi:hypothetical protein